MVLLAGEKKIKVVGPWKRTNHRDMRQIRFVATASGFNSHGWEKWKARGGRTQDTFFQDGMFVLHNKFFKERVPNASTTCPQVSWSSR